jgi:hypothetical protein
MLLIALLLVAVAAQDEGAPACRTRNLEDLKMTSTGRLVWTPHIRRGSLIANTFFSAAEFPCLLVYGRPFVKKKHQKKKKKKKKKETTKKKRNVRRLVFLIFYFTGRSSSLRDDEP